jgi:hypothetical protein
MRTLLRSHKTRSLHNIGAVDYTAFNHTLDIGGVCDVIGRIRVQNNEIGEISLLESADVRAGFAAEQLRGVRSSTLQNLHRRQPGFSHQLKLAEQSRTMNGADVSRVGAGCDRNSSILQSL